MANVNDKQPTIQNDDTQPTPQSGDEQKTPAPGSGILAGLPKDVVGDLPVNSVARNWYVDLLGKQPQPTSDQKAAAAEKTKANAPVVERDQPAPGSFGDKLSGAMSGLEADLGDAAHATDVKGGGWLSGVVSTLNARSMRLAQEKKDAALIAKTQADTVLLHRNAYKQDMEIQNSLHAHNQDYVDTMKVNHNMQSDVSFDQLHKRMQTEKDFAQKYNVRETGNEPVLDADGSQKKDRNGNPVTSPTYTIIDKRTKDGTDDNLQLSAEDSAAMKKYHIADLPANTKLTEPQYGSLNVKLGLVRQGVQILNLANGKEFNDDQIKMMAPYLGDETVLAAISHVPGSPYGGMKQFIDNADQHIEQYADAMEKAKAANNQGAYDVANSLHQGLMAERDKVSKIMSMSVTDKQKDEYNKDQQTYKVNIAEYSKDPSKIEGHTSAVIASADAVLANPDASPVEKAEATRVKGTAQSVRRLEVELEGEKETEKSKVKANTQQGTPNPNGLTGEAFLKTLPPGRAQTMRDIALGRTPINPASLERTDKGQAFLADLESAYPGFDAFKGMAWPKIYADYIGTSTLAQGRVNYNTALRHMEDLYNTSTYNGLYNPLSQDYRDRQASLAIITGELAKAVKNGVATEGESEAIKKSLSGWTDNDAKERASHAAGLLMEKIEEWQDAFQKAAPSAAIQVPKLISPEAEKAYDFISSGGQRTPEQLEQQRKSERGNQQHGGALAPKQAVKPNSPGKAANGTLVWEMKDGTIQDAKGKQYDPKTGQPL